MWKGQATRKPWNFSQCSRIFAPKLSCLRCRTQAPCVRCTPFNPHEVHPRQTQSIGTGRENLGDVRISALLCSSLADELGDPEKAHHPRSSRRLCISLRLESNLHLCWSSSEPTHTNAAVGLLAFKRCHRKSSVSYAILAQARQHVHVGTETFALAVRSNSSDPLTPSLVSFFVSQRMYVDVCTYVHTLLGKSGIKSTTARDKFRLPWISTMRNHAQSTMACNNLFVWLPCMCPCIGKPYPPGSGQPVA